MRRAAMFATGLIFISLAVRTLAEEPKHQHGPAPSSPALEPFKALDGKWVGKMKFGGGDSLDTVVTYRTTSGGTAVVETISPGGPHEMVSMIHPDGDGLVLTHYCALGNQPRMKAKGSPHKVAFAFVDATNLKNPDEMHMHDVVYEFVDKDTIKSEWTNYVNGKPHDKATFELKRAK